MPSIPLRSMIDGVVQQCTACGESNMPCCGPSGDAEEGRDPFGFAAFEHKLKAHRAFLVDGNHAIRKEHDGNRYGEEVGEDEV